MCEGERALLIGGELLARASCNHYAKWLLLLWNHEQSPHDQVECFLMLTCEGANSPYYHPSFSIPPPMPR